MPKIKLILLFFTFSILLGITSILKTQTRIIEKNINKVNLNIVSIEKDLHETQLDFVYLSSPSNLSKKINDFALIEYFPMDFSRIYLNEIDFTKSKKNLTILKKNEKKNQKKY